MKELDLLLAQNKDFNFVGVQFNGNNRVYYYKTTEKFEVNDYAIVSTSEGFKVVKVVEVNCMLSISDHINYVWIVQKVDTSKYDHCRKVEAELQSQLNTLRVAKLCKDVEAELAAEIGEDGVKQLVRL